MGDPQGRYGANILDGAARGKEGLEGIKVSRRASLECDGFDNG